MEHSISQRAYHNLLVKKGADYKIMKALLERYGSWVSAWKGESGGATASIENAESFLSEGLALMLAEEKTFPVALRNISWSPFGLYSRGIMPEESIPRIAIVGTRKATAQGLILAREFGEAFAKAGACVVSGLALGIDAAAHEGALAGRGKTIAVVAHGLHTIYPKQNERLALRMLESGGAILSEYPSGIPSFKHRFIERNRIVSGLSAGVVVIEAPERSGSLATARFALDQGREVFVVPGPAKSPNYKGAHKLVKDGAHLVTEPSEVLEILGFAATEKSPKRDFSYLEKEEQRVAEAILASSSAIGVDAIAEQTSLTAEDIMGIVSILTLEGIIKEDGGKYFV